MKRPTWTINWVDEMSVGIPEIDNDHKHFVFLIHELNRSITELREPSEIKLRLQVIVNDAVRHFSVEERLFKEWKYPNTEAHENIHTLVLGSLNSMMNDFVPYGHDSSWIDIGLRIKTILMHHIMVDDMVYAEFYRNSLKTKPVSKEDSVSEAALLEMVKS